MHRPNPVTALLWQCEPPTPEEIADAAASLSECTRWQCQELLARAERWAIAMAWCGVALSSKLIDEGENPDRLPKIFKSCTIAARNANAIPPTATQCTNPPPRVWISPERQRTLQRYKQARLKRKGKGVEPPRQLTALLKMIEQIVSPIEPIGKLRIIVYRVPHGIKSTGTSWWVEVPGMNICEGGKLLRDALAKVRDRLVEISRYGEVQKPPQQLPLYARKIYIGDVELHGNGTLTATIYEDDGGESP